MIARSKHGPDNPCVLVGDGNRCAVEPAPLPKLVGPLAHGIVFIGRGSDNGTGAMNQQATQMLASPLGDAHEHGPVTARKLSRDQAKPGSHVATIPEVRGIADCRYDGCRRFGANAFDSGDALAGFARFEDSLDFLVEVRDAAIEIAEEIPELGNGLAGHSRQTGLSTRENVRDHAPGSGIPDNQWTGKGEVPATLAAACEFAIEAEIENITLYDRLIPQIDDMAVKQVFQNLQDASRDNHLPAIRRFLAREGDDGNRPVGGRERGMGGRGRGRWRRP